MNKKIFVSGCYDMLHSGHVAFFEEAALLGDLYVGIGSDCTIKDLKGRQTINTEAERLYMIKALRTVKDAWVNSGSGLLDFEEDLKKLKPDIFFVNEDGNSAEKEKLCKILGIEYIVSKRIPHANLPTRSTTSLREVCNIPYRIDIAGGWLDQPSVSSLYPGGVITLCIEPDFEFNDRSGMATSSRKKAIELWQTDLPEGKDLYKTAKTLFCVENEPGRKYVSGSQDSFGIVYPGVNFFYYDNDFYPKEILSNTDEDTLDFLEKHLFLIPMYPRQSNYAVLDNTNINAEDAKQLSLASKECWDAICTQNLSLLGKAVKDSFHTQINMYPNMLNEDIKSVIDSYKDQAIGWKISGAGGGGYIIFVAKEPLDKAIRIRARRA